MSSRVVRQQTWLFKIKKTAERWKRNFSGDSNIQQQISSSKSMPVDTGYKALRGQQQPTMAPRGEPDPSKGARLATGQAPVEHQPGRCEPSAPVGKTPPPGMTISCQPPTAANNNDTQPAGQMGQPIELIVTSASESPGGEPAPAPATKTTAQAAGAPDWGERR